MLSQDNYYSVIQQTQIVSVDLLVTNNNQFLLGKRTNSPAKGYFFCPGGRVFKGEPIRDAVKRILEDEVGLEYDSCDTLFLGTYEHVYSDNFRDDKFGTHYISMAFMVNLPSVFQKLSVLKNMKKQHSDIKWMTPADMAKSDDVHQFVKYFFDGRAPNRVN